MGSNPITKETKTKESVRRPGIWTKEQYEAVESIAEPQWRMLMRLGVNGVARKGSLAKLKVEDVDIENNLVRCWDENDPAKRATKAARKKDKGEQGPTPLFLTEAGRQSILFRGLGAAFPVWMKHNWMAEHLPEGWTLTGSTAKCPVAAMERGHFYALQFHPEPQHSLFGRIVLDNWLTLACGLDTPYF